MAKTVLIVDDNEHLRRIFAIFLESRGYQTSEAASGHEAIEDAIANKPNLILLDLTLPDMKGTDAAEAIMKDPCTADIPIIGCSADLNPELRHEALRVRMADYIQKPISAAKIAAIVEQFFPQKR